jgi:hypothetical protein
VLKHTKHTTIITDFLFHGNILLITPVVEKMLVQLKHQK